MKHLIIVLTAIGCGLGSVAQKPVIDTGLFTIWPNNWPCITTVNAISDDGKYVMYPIDNAPCNCQEIVVSSTSGNWKKQIDGAWDARFCVDGKSVIFLQGTDSLCIWRLGSEDREYIGGVEGASYKLNTGGEANWLAFKKAGKEQILVLRDVETGKERFYPGVSDYALSENGKVLLVQYEFMQNNEPGHRLTWVNTKSGEEHEIWRGKRARGYVFNEKEDGVCYYAQGSTSGRSDRQLWFCGEKDKEARLLVQSGQGGIDTSLNVSDGRLVFSHDGSRIFFNLMERNLPQALPGSVGVDIWNYKDKELQSTQLQNVSPSAFLMVINLGNGQLIQLQQEDEQISDLLSPYNDDVRLVQKGGGNSEEMRWNAASRPMLYLESTIDGKRESLKDHPSGFDGLGKLSPDGRWFVYYDQEQKTYYSYDRDSKKTNNLTRTLNIEWGQGYLSNCCNTATPGLRGPSFAPAGFGGWLKGGNRVLIYSQYDIWLFDPSGKAPPQNITGGYGTKHHIQFRLMEHGHLLELGQIVMVTAFNEGNEDHGVYRLELGKRVIPEQLSMGAWNYVYNGFLKARHADEWLIGRMAPNEYPNYWLTSDMRHYAQISDLAPQKAYNWMTTELVHWKKSDGKTMTGILYKPEDFDPQKKYPVILNYYEKRSDGLNDFIQPQASQGDINIPYFVSRGYLVLAPDIEYHIGDPGGSALRCIESAAKYLSGKPWVDSKHMGINGHSFGGFETNFVVTHSHLFAAACEVAGPADLISQYGGLFYGYGGASGASQAFMFENGHSQLRMGSNPWERLDLYIKNSPIFKAGEVTTPLLMVHNQKDCNVPFEQAVEFFTGLRRMGKKVWLLQYDNSAHILNGMSMDYTIRLEQFFDYYLKGTPPPVWMTQGVPAKFKGVRTGLELDLSGKQP